MVTAKQPTCPSRSTSPGSTRCGSRGWRFLDRFKNLTDAFEPLPPLSTAPLAALTGGADRVAVVDCETTGVYNSDRIVEIAIVTVDLNGQVIDEWDTLVQPQRDVGASHIHGLTAESLRDAPTFADIAGDIAIRLHGACLAAHNLGFDRRMLTNEYERIGADFAAPSGLDTLTATRCRLEVACTEHRITLVDHHSALADATATATLLIRVASGCGTGGPAAAPVGLTRSGRVLRRGVIATVVVPDPPHVAQLAYALNHDGIEADMLAYLDVLGRAVSDLHIDRNERAELAVWAAELGLNEAQLAQAHRRYMNDLIDAALADDVVTDDELDVLLRVGSALEVDPKTVEQRTRPARITTTTVPLTEGMSVTFTGDDPAHTRAELIDRATSFGLIVGKSVTKQTDLLVVYEADTSSGKATKARSYGVPIITTTQFAGASLGDPLEAIGSSTETKKVVTCPDCHATWTVGARSGAQSTRRCEDCAPPRPATHPSAPRSAVPAAPTIETLTCTDCGLPWVRERVRGRKPQRCPSCSGDTHPGVF